MYVEDLQNDLPTAIQDVRELLADLECAESCDNKGDFCENLRSANLKIVTLKFFLSKLLKDGEKCKGYASV